MPLKFLSISKGYSALILKSTRLSSSSKTGAIRKSLLAISEFKLILGNFFNSSFWNCLIGSSSIFSLGNSIIANKKLYPNSLTISSEGYGKSKKSLKV